MARPRGSGSSGPAGGARGRCWQAMRILRRFTAADICATAEAGARNVNIYLQVLTRAGYLRVLQPQRPGVTGGHIVYLLVRNTGPYAPRVRSGGVLWDPNRPRPGRPPIGEVRP